MTPEQYLSKLTPKQKKAILLLASGIAGKEVANAINCKSAL